MNSYDFLKKEDKEGKWQDTQPLNYDTEENQNHLIAELWVPFIRKYIVDFGFLGVRVDAIINVDSTLQKKIYKIILELCKEKHQTSPVIMGELMAGNPSEHVEKLRGIGFTHIFAPGPFYHNFSTEEAPQLWLEQQINDLQAITQSGNPVENQGGVVCFGGNHDVGSLKAICLLESGKMGNKKFPYLKQITCASALNKKWNEVMPEISSLMREKLFFSVFMCNGGWYLLSGDEFGVVHRPLVFKEYNETKNIDESFGGNEDLTQFITNMNFILENLPRAHLKDRTQCFRATLDRVYSNREMSMK